MNFITHDDNLYPAFQASHNAARFIIPFAVEVCKGTGFDVGAGRSEWKLPGSIAIDPVIDDRFDALHFPDVIPNYIFSSHCLEHTEDYVEVLNYWTEKLADNGIIFLYLPDFSQSYWRPWNNRKHKHAFTVEILRQYFIDSGRYRNIFHSRRDLNNSFAIFAEKIK